VLIVIRASCAAYTGCCELTDLSVCAFDFNVVCSVVTILVLIIYIYMSDVIQQPDADVLFAAFLHCFIPAAHLEFQKRTFNCV